MSLGLKCLAVDDDPMVYSLYQTAWEMHGVEMIRVDTMVEAIKALMINDFIFVGINGDRIDFMGLLAEMRSVTNIPIMIATSHVDTETQVAALNNGANLYGQWHESPNGNVLSVLAHIARITDDIKAPRRLLIYKDLLLAPHSRKVMVGTRSIDLSGREFDLLHYLMNNYGVALSYDQIYEHVWGREHVGSSRMVLRNTIMRLREKLKDNLDGPDFIATVPDFGYRFP